MGMKDSQEVCQKLGFTLGETAAAGYSRVLNILEIY